MLCFQRKQVKGSCCKGVVSLKPSKVWFLCLVSKKPHQANLCFFKLRDSSPSLLAKRALSLKASCGFFESMQVDSSSCFQRKQHKGAIVWVKTFSCFQKKVSKGIHLVRRSVFDASFFQRIPFLPS